MGICSKTVRGGIKRHALLISGSIFSDKNFLERGFYWKNSLKKAIG